MTEMPDLQGDQEKEKTCLPTDYNKLKVVSTNQIKCCHTIHLEENQSK